MNVMMIQASSDLGWWTHVRVQSGSHARGDDDAVVVTFFNHNFVNCKATLILAIKIYEIKYNINLNDILT